MYAEKAHSSTLLITGSTQNYALAAIGFVVLLLICYPDRPIGVKSRKNIITIKPAYPLTGNITWILSVLMQRTRLLDEIFRLQREQAPGGKPFTLTFPALGGRVTVINNPAYLHHVQKVRCSLQTLSPALEHSEI